MWIRGENANNDGLGIGLVRSMCEPMCEPVPALSAPLTKTDTPIRPERDSRTGRFVKGNGAAVKTALRAGRAHLPEVFSVLESQVREFLEASVADDGGRADMPARRLSQHQYRAVLHRQILRLNAALEVHGLFDRRGRLRLAWLGKLESLMREARAIDSLLGLARRASVPTLEEFLAGQRDAEEADDGGEQ